MKPTKEHLAIINSRLAEHKMTTDSVAVLPFLVFNTKVTDRYTIMSREMLAKMAQDLSDGKVAFNKLHNSRSSLPVGSSISGRLVENDGGTDLQAMMYAVLKRPDGTVFEEGKDLADRYATGAARACSAGLLVGFYKCNICGNDIRSWEDCEHIPGREYKVDEQPIICIALMTGHEIVDGIAQDCGIYEVSAVTAGGVAAASSMTEAFGAYEEGADVAEFKKSVVKEKQPSLRVEFTTAPVQDETLFSQEEENMEKKDVEQMLKDHYDPLQQELKALKEAATEAATAYAALETELATKVEEISTLTAKVTEFEAKVSEFEAKEDLTPFKDAYVAVVTAQAVKAGTEATFEGKSLDELTAAMVEYEGIIAKLPSGQQLKGGDTASAAPSLNSSFYKI